MRSLFSGKSDQLTVSEQRGAIMLLILKTLKKKFHHNCLDKMGWYLEQQSTKLGVNGPPSYFSFTIS